MRTTALEKGSTFLNRGVRGGTSGQVTFEIRKKPEKEPE